MKNIEVGRSAKIMNQIQKRLIWSDSQMNLNIKQKWRMPLVLLKVKQGKPLNARDAFIWAVMSRNLRIMFEEFNLDSFSKETFQVVDSLGQQGDSRKQEHLVLQKETPKTPTVRLTTNTVALLSQRTFNITSATTMSLRKSFEGMFSGKSSSRVPCDDQQQDSFSWNLSKDGKQPTIERVSSKSRKIHPLNSSSKSTTVSGGISRVMSTLMYSVGSLTTRVGDNSAGFSNSEHSLVARTESGESVTTKILNFSSRAVKRLQSQPPQSDELPEIVGGFFAMDSAKFGRKGKQEKEKFGLKLISRLFGINNKIQPVL